MDLCDRGANEDRCFSQSQWAQTVMQEVPSKHQKALLYCAGNGALEVGVQGGCGVSHLRDLGKPNSGSHLEITGL